MVTADGVCWRRYLTLIYNYSFHSAEGPAKVNNGMEFPGVHGG